MRFFFAALTSMLAVSSPVFAQGEDEEALPEASESSESSEAPAQPITGSATQEQQFKIRRGFFAEGDLGIFVTIGGANTNRPNPNTGGPSPKSISNLQPYVGLTFGYDLFHTDVFNFGLGVRLAMGLNGGAGRASTTDPVEALTKSNDYSMQEAGLAINMVFMVTDRLALTVKLDGGAGFLTPDPTLFATDPGAGKGLFAPVFGGAFGLELYTLLNDFSIGIQGRFVGAIGAGEFIPGLSATIPIKYTF